MNGTPQPRRAGWNLEFHALMLACALAGALLATCAGDLGPFAPLLIAQGLCAVLMGVLGEAIYGIGAAVRRIGRRRCLASKE